MDQNRRSSLASALTALYPEHPHTPTLFQGEGPIEAESPLESSPAKPKDTARDWEKRGAGRQADPRRVNVREQRRASGHPGVLLTK